MAAGKRRLFHAFRISRKLVLLSGGFLLVLGASGTAALMFAPARLIPGYSQNEGGYCKTIYQSSFRRGDERRLIAVIATSDLDPAARVRTGVRVARHLASTLKPDLVIVQVADTHGPTTRAELRGAAIGAEIVHAPNPSKSLAVSKPWEARYANSLPTRGGFYFGPRIDMRLTDLEVINHELEQLEETIPEDEHEQACAGDEVDEEPKTVSVDAKKAGGHEPAKTGH
ncbi:hypothetical protein OEG84_12090 [Hoeflea sp. G2-23]|uniref:Uncharacterized protein n=1 Tax=Hoeflea algicola TaxID=2983763 RepID=A0ABT3ZB02_9HYPH|nr:hypothetical protein [Hoeflea algicola]MCY0148431.1 hypothetical protein [Hoeflea algicola]